MNANVRTKPKTSGPTSSSRLLSPCRPQSSRRRRTRRLRPDRSSVARPLHAASRARPVTRVRAVADERNVDLCHGLVRADVDRDRVEHLVGGQRLRSRAAIARCTGCAVTSSALMATIAALIAGERLVEPGTGRSRGSRCRRRWSLRVEDSAGTVIATSRARRRRETSGRRRTRSRMAPHTRDSPSLRRRRCTNGMRPFSTRSPSFDSSAGSTVSEPIIAIATTIIVPIENDMNDLSPERNMPPIAIRTVMPEIRTARPEVAAAASSAARSPRRPSAPRAHGGGRRASSRRRRRGRSGGSPRRSARRPG